MRLRLPTADCDGSLRPERRGGRLEPRVSVAGVGVTVEAVRRDAKAAATYPRSVSSAISPATSVTSHRQPQTRSLPTARSRRGHPQLRGRARAFSTVLHETVVLQRRDGDIGGGRRDPRSSPELAERDPRHRADVPEQRVPPRREAERLERVRELLLPRRDHGQQRDGRAERRRLGHLFRLPATLPDEQVVQVARRREERHAAAGGRARSWAEDRVA